MASRKNYNKTRRPDEFEPPQIYASFMKDLLAGTVTATKLVDGRDGNGNVKLQYDDPN